MSRLQKIWPSVVERVQLAAKEKTLVLFYWSSIQVNSPLQAWALKSPHSSALEFSKPIPSAGVTTRNCASMAVFLEEIWTSPATCHDVRIMADFLYLLTLHMTKSVLSVMPEEDYVHIDLLCYMSYIGGMTWKHPSLF